MMVYEDDWGAWIHKARTDAGITVRKLCSTVHMSFDTYYRVVSKGETSLLTLLRLLTGLWIKGQVRDPNLINRLRCEEFDVL